MPSSIIIQSCIGSVAIIGSVLLYLVYKKQKPADDPRVTQIKSSRQTSLEIKVPNRLVMKVIGRAGARVKEIQAETQTKIYFHESCQTDQEERICVIRGQSENVTLAANIVHNIILSETKKASHDMYIPSDAIGQLIGVGGRNIRRIQKMTDTEITINPEEVIRDSIKTRQLIIKGSPEKITACISMIEQDIEEDNEYSSLYLQYNENKIKSHDTPKMENGVMTENTTFINTETISSNA